MLVKPAGGGKCTRDCDRDGVASGGIEAAILRILDRGRDEEDAAVPDKESDIKPRHYSGKTHGLEHEQNGEDGGAGKRVGAYGEELDEGDEDDYDDLDDDEKEPAPARLVRPDSGIVVVNVPVIPDRRSVDVPRSVRDSSHIV